LADFWSLAGLPGLVVVLLDGCRVCVVPVDGDDDVPPDLAGGFGSGLLFGPLYELPDDPDDADGAGDDDRLPGVCGSGLPVPAVRGTDDTGDGDDDLLPGFCGSGLPVPAVRVADGDAAPVLGLAAAAPLDGGLGMGLLYEPLDDEDDADEPRPPAGGLGMGLLYDPPPLLEEALEPADDERDGRAGNGLPPLDDLVGLDCVAAGLVVPNPLGWRPLRCSDDRWRSDARRDWSVRPSLPFL